MMLGKHGRHFEDNIFNVALLAELLGLSSIALKFRRDKLSINFHWFRYMASHQAVNLTNDVPFHFHKIHITGPDIYIYI